MAKTNAERQAAYRERRKAGQLTLTDRLSAVEVHLEALERRVRELEDGNVPIGYGESPIGRMLRRQELSVRQAVVGGVVEQIRSAADDEPDALADLRERVAEVTKPPIPMPEVEETE